MFYVNWTIFIIYTLIVGAVIVVILMENRQPAKTMAWILVLFFMPLLGLILYLFFGRNRKKEKFISQQSLDLLTKRSMLEFAEQENLHIPYTHKTLMQFFANEGWALPFKDNKVETYTDGYGFFLELIKQLGQAKHHIHIDTYIFGNDALGRLISDILSAKAQAGVIVRLIYDDVGCWNVRESFFEKMRKSGVDVRAFMPVKYPAFTSKINYRNHRKLCVIDGKIGFIGGMNIALRYVKGTAKQAWRDTHMKIEGGAVYGIQRAFLVDWYFVARRLITDRIYYPPISSEINNECVAQVVASSSVSSWPYIMQGYVRILHEARKYVYIETPYFLPTEPVQFAMRMAVLAGVNVKLMMPLHTDSKLLDWASKSFLQEMREAGVEIYFYKAGFNHSKLLVCDDTLCTCGSTNVDFRSFENNFEANVFFYDSVTVAKMKSIFLADLEKCIPYEANPKMKKSGFFMRLWESIVRLLAPLL